MSLQILEAYGISAAEIMAASLNFTLNVKVDTSATSVDAGKVVTFTTTVTNLGTDSAKYILFSSTPPTCLSNVNNNIASVLSSGDYISDGASSPTYLLMLTNAITMGNSIKIKVWGSTANCGTSTITYKAYVSPWYKKSDTDIFSASLGVVGNDYLLYLPFVRRDPTPTPTPTPAASFYDGFSDNNSGWAEDENDNKCVVGYESGTYQIKAKEDKDCFSPAPDNAEYDEGTFKVTANHYSGSDNFATGIYINGDGGDYYYALEVSPNDQSWKLVRNYDGDTSTLDNDDSSVIDSDGANIIQLKHNDNILYVTINGSQLATYNANDNEDDNMDGDGTGIFVLPDDNDNVTVRFDDFTVIK